MSIQAVRYALEDSTVYGPARAVLMCLAFHAGATGETWPSTEMIARECGIRRQAAARALAVLRQVGEIELLSPSTARHSARYRLARFAQVANVGAPTMPQEPGYGAETPRSKSEEFSREPSRPEPKRASIPVPLYQRDGVDRPANSRDALDRPTVPAGRDYTPENASMGRSDRPAPLNSRPTVSEGRIVVSSHGSGAPPPSPPSGGRQSIVFKIYGEWVGVWLGRHRRLPRPNGELTAARAADYVRWYQERGFEARLIPAPGGSDG